MDWVKCRICKESLDNEVGRVYRNGHALQKIYCLDCELDDGDKLIGYGFFNQEKNQIDFIEDDCVIIKEET